MDYVRSVQLSLPIIIIIINGLFCKCGLWLILKEQLDAYHSEKLSLLNTNRSVLHDLDNLSRDYANLLGHQNQKQKIKHVLKLKDDNSALKKVCAWSLMQFVLMLGARFNGFADDLMKISTMEWDASILADVAVKAVVSHYKAMDMLEQTKKCALILLSWSIRQ